jgi:hypothetical protein
MEQKEIAGHFGNGNCLKVTKNSYTNEEINISYLANIVRSDYLKPPRCSQNAHSVSLVAQTECLKL